MKFNKIEPKTKFLFPELKIILIFRLYEVIKINKNQLYDIFCFTSIILIVFVSCLLKLHQQV